LTEAQFEPGSNVQVLKNRLGIKTPAEMDAVEARALQRLMEEVVRQYGEKHRFTAADICGLHKAWLAEIYDPKFLSCHPHETRKSTIFTSSYGNFFQLRHSSFLVFRGWQKDRSVSTCYSD
jgi:hypothetical protein